MKGSWGLTGRILSGEKSIESRWYLAKRSPWGKVKQGDRIYFKDSGRPVSASAMVSRVELISNLNPAKVKSLLKLHGARVGIRSNEITGFYRRFRDKRYCMLVFLRDARAIKPFNIDKSGFGSMAAWITVNKVNGIKVKTDDNMAKKVMAFGSFDFLHPGHVHYLTRASRLGNYLIVVVARDSSIRSIKGKKPIFHQEERARLVGSLKMVDKAVVGNRLKRKEDIYLIIKQHRPDVIVFGYDQRVDLPKMKLWLRKNGIRARVVRIKSSLNPKIYKSSVLKAKALGY
jgi:FAD synthetase